MMRSTGFQPWQKQHKTSVTICYSTKQIVARVNIPKGEATVADTRKPDGSKEEFSTHQEIEKRAYELYLKSG
jgi:hypothetical protein